MELNREIFFESETRLSTHIEFHKSKRDEYLNLINELYANEHILKNINIMNKAHVLVVLIHNKEHAQVETMHKWIDLPEMTKACEILDSNRRVRQTIGKCEKMKDLKKKKMCLKFMDDLKNLADGNFDLSLTSSKCKLIKRWTYHLTKDQLEYRAILFPTNLWRKLANLIHLNSKNDFVLDWFLPFCYGKEAPEDSIVKIAQKLSYQNFQEFYQTYCLNYEFVRTRLPLEKTHNNYSDHVAIDNIKKFLVENENINTILWYWHELYSDKNKHIVIKRLKEAQKAKTINITYGKLVDLLINITDKDIFDLLVSITEEKMIGYKMNLPSPTAVFADASASMDVAIRTSSIITSLLCYMSNAMLSLFNNINTNIDNPPRTVSDAVHFAKTMKAQCCTSPAATMGHYYESKILAKTIIIVTDEEENTHYKGLMFDKWYQKYIKDVYPAKLIFISFLDMNSSLANKDGRMVKQLKSTLGTSMVDEYVDVFRFSIRNPDLNKLDSILTKLQLPRDVVKNVIVDTKKQTEEKKQKVNEMVESMVSDHGFPTIDDSYDVV